MKPTLEQLQEWRSQALEYAHAITNQYPSWKDAVDLKFAELAAAWGASQAQQTTEPLGFQIRRAIAAEDELRATKQTLEHAYAALQKVADKAQQTTEPELPEPFGYLSVHKVEGPFKYQFNKERAEFEAWYASAIWGNEDYKQSLFRAWREGREDLIRKLATVSVEPVAFHAQDGTVTSKS